MLPLSVVVLLAWQFALVAPAQAAAGDLDPSFGVGGKLTTDFATGPDRARAVVVQADGKLVAAGYALTETSRDFAVARYLAR